MDYTDTEINAAAARLVAEGVLNVLPDPADAWGDIEGIARVRAMDVVDASGKRRTRARFQAAYRDQIADIMRAPVEASLVSEALGRLRDRDGRSMDDAIRLLSEALGLCPLCFDEEHFERVKDPQTGTVARASRPCPTEGA